MISDCDFPGLEPCLVWKCDECHTENCDCVEVMSLIKIGIDRRVKLVARWPNEIICHYCGASWALPEGLPVEEIEE